MTLTATPSIYLVGPIRDGREDDIAWREQVIQNLDGRAVFLNPLAGKTYDAEKRTWMMSAGVAPAADGVSESGAGAAGVALSAAGWRIL
jgi:hypothetical protein